MAHPDRSYAYTERIMAQRNGRGPMNYIAMYHQPKDGIAGAGPLVFVWQSQGNGAHVPKESYHEALELYTRGRQNHIAHTRTPGNPRGDQEFPDWPETPETWNGDTSRFEEHAPEAQPTA